jgi:hypothetical protein
MESALYYPRSQEPASKSQLSHLSAVHTILCNVSKIHFNIPHLCLQVAYFCLVFWQFCTFPMPCLVFWILCPSHPCQVSEAYELWRSSLCNFVHPSVTSCLLDPFSSNLGSQSPSNCVFFVITKPSSTTIKNSMRKYNLGSETGRSEMHVGKHLWIHSASNFGVLLKICWTYYCMWLIHCRKKCAVNL